MSEKPEVGEEAPTEPAAVSDEALDDVTGGTGSGTGKVPIKDDDSFVSFPPDFLKVMAYREADATFASSAGRSVSEIFDNLTADE